MRVWGYGINSYHKTASIHIEDAAWWIWGLDWLVDKVCSFIIPIPLPPIPIRLWDKDSIEFNGGKKWIKLNEWVDNLRGLFCCFVHQNVSNFCWKRIESKFLEIDYDKLRELLYDGDSKFWNECEQIDVDEGDDDNI